MTKMTSRHYREKLIDEVKKYPVLYDTRHENHRDIDVRDRCWLEISEKLGANSEVLKREWKCLRDSMRQALKRTKRGMTTKAGVPCKKWRFEARMAFILPYMTMRRTHREVRDTDIDIKMDEGMEEATQQSEEETEVWDTGHSNGDHDSLDLFFASVCQSTKRLPKKYQNAIKRQVLDALLKVEDEYESEQNTAAKLVNNKATQATLDTTETWNLIFGSGSFYTKRLPKIYQNAIKRQVLDSLLSLSSETRKQ